MVAGLGCCTSEISVPFRAGTPESYCALAHLEWSLLCHLLTLSVSAFSKMYEMAAARSWVATAPPCPTRYFRTKALYPLLLISTAYGKPSWTEPT